MRVLLTGASGFVGTAVAAELAAAGHEVVGVDALIPQAHQDGATGEGVHRLDVRDADDWRHLLRGVDVVCHQAALVGAGVTVGDLPLYAAHNDLGTAALMSAMTAEGVDRLVLASSMVVYGEGRYCCPEHGVRRPGPRDPAALRAGMFECSCPVCGSAMGWQLVGEDAPFDPRSAYAASKVAQEHYAAAWARSAGAAVLALRYHNVYGPHMPRDTPYSGVAAIFRSRIEAGHPPEVFEDGAQTRDFVHVRDVARANRLAVEVLPYDAPGSVRAYNVCSGAPVTVAEVAELVVLGASRHGAVGPAPVVTGAHRPGDVRHVVASPDRAADELGFRAEVRPEDGLAAFATEPLR
jgi:dTDP-L-rhamnose 4-epimerase